MLAERLERDANSWQDVSTVVPLLRQKKYYRNLPHGYARGTEPVRYVDRIKTYYGILVQTTQQTPQNPRQPSEMDRTFQLSGLKSSM
jgi:membrane-bound lytic murein transglycosylase F